jgi:hypothetical protein
MEELERLEEKKERKRTEGQKKLAEQQKASKVIAAAFKQFPSNPTNTNSFNLVLFNQLVHDIPESYLDNSDA